MNPDYRRTDAQNKAIWALVGKISRLPGMDMDDAKETCRRLAREVSGQESTKELTVSQARQLIDRLTNLLDGRPETTIISKKSHKSPVQPEGDVLTQAQQRALSLVRDALHMDQSAYVAFCRRMTGAPWPQTKVHGIQVYEGLEALLLRRYPRAQVAQLAQAVLKAPHISSEDETFARSIVKRIEGNKRLGAGHLGIILKIGERYGLVLTPIPDNPGGRDRAQAE